MSPVPPQEIFSHWILFFFYIFIFTSTLIEIVPYNVQKGHVEFLIALFSFPAIPTATLQCHPLVSKPRALVSCGFMCQPDSMAEMLRHKITMRTSIIKFRNRWFAMALAWWLGLVRKLSGRSLVCHLGFRVLQNEGICVGALQGWQGENLALLRCLQRHSASLLPYCRCFLNRSFFTRLGVISPQNQKATCGKCRRHFCGWAGQHFTLQTRSSHGFVQKQGAEKWVVQQLFTKSRRFLSLAGSC